jgi:hypothetical protein
LKQNNLKKKKNIESQLKLQATRVISKEYPSLYKMSMHNTDKLHYAAGGWGKRTDQSFNSCLDEFIKSSVEGEWNHHSPGEHINGDLTDLKGQFSDVGGKAPVQIPGGPRSPLF